MDQLSNRPELDGLRAISVILVLFYHLFIPGFEFGYLGVDIFFVISGFLITKLLVKEHIRYGSINLKNFYIRRARRLLPSLYLTLFITTIVAYILFPPYRLNDYSNSLLYSVFSISNFWFRAKTGYFDPGANSTPLLHTWSLGIEEQFYLFWPLMVISFFIFKKRMIPLLIFVFIIAVSFYSNISQVYTEKDLFFLLPFRIFEFGLGALSCLVKKKDFKKHIIPLIIHSMAILLAFSPFFILTTKTSYPAVYTLMTCFGVCLILAFNNQSLIFKALSYRPFVFIGKMSYAIYLVHWPLIVYYLYITGRQLVFLDKAFITTACIALAWLMTNFIEKHIRFKEQRTLLFSNKQFGYGVATLTLILFSISLFGINNSSLWRSEVEVYKDFSKANYASFASYGRDSLKNYDKYFQSKNKKKVLVVGDSMAGDFLNILLHTKPNESHFEIKSNFIDFNCKFLLVQKDKYYKKPEIKHCKSQHELYLQKIINSQADVIILATRWEEQTIRELQKIIPYIANSTNSDLYILGLKELANNDLVWANLKTFDKVNPLSFVSRPAKNTILINNKIRQLSKNQNFAFIDILKNICSRQSCPKLTSKGEPFYYDAQHLTVYGIELVSKTVVNEAWYNKIFSKKRNISSNY